MNFGRVLLRSSLQCSKSLCFQRINSVLKKLYSSSASHSPKVRAFQPSAHWFGLQATAQPCCYLPAVSDMQPSCLSYGRETNVVASDDEDDDEECGGENLVEQDSRMQKEDMIISGQLDLQSMARIGITETRTSTVSPASKGSNEKISKSKIRREKKKLMKKKLKSSDASASLMSELPFALTSPTTWKELGFPNSDSAQRKRKLGDGGGQVDSEEGGDKKKKRKGAKDQTILSLSPSPTLSSAVTEVQEVVLQQEPRLAKAMIPVPTLHITLLVTHLAHQEQVDLAAAVLAQAEQSVAELLGGRDLMLPFSGIRHFRKEVVFVGLATGQHTRTLDSLAGLLRSRFEEQGLLQGEGRGFEPHLTIMKLSRASKLRSQGIKRVDPALYSDYTSKFFGNQMVERVDLCSMLKKKQQDGYYHTETSLQLS